MKTKTTTKNEPRDPRRKTMKTENDDRAEAIEKIRRLVGDKTVPLNDVVPLLPILPEWREWTRPRRKKRAKALYLTDNGALLCRDHLGETARTTGRDISGQKIHRLTAAERDYLVRECGRCACETCAAIAAREKV